MTTMRPSHEPSGTNTRYPQVIERTDTYLKMMDEDGVVKKIALATPGQVALIAALREKLGLKPLKSLLPIYKASKMIEELKLKVQQQGERLL